MDKPKGIMLLIGKHMDKHGPDKEPEDDMMDDGDDGEKEQMEKSAVADLIKGIRNNDVEMAHEALRDFIELCMGTHDEAEEEEDHPEMEAKESGGY